MPLPWRCLTAASSVPPCPLPPEHKDLLKYTLFVASNAIPELDMLRLGPDWVGIGSTGFDPAWL